MSTSLLPVRSLVLVCVCGIAAMIVACADGARTLTGPSGSPAAGSLETAPLPFQGSLEATDSDSVSFPFLSVHMAGGGNATHLGTYTAVFDFQVDLRAPASPAVGTFTLTAANGDTIVGSLLGRAQIADGIATVVESATITGGTGRFATATGSFTVHRTVVQATGVTSGSFDGTLTLHN
jgi:hypothetical protein